MIFPRSRAALSPTARPSRVPPRGPFCWAAGRRRRILLLSKKGRGTAATTTAPPPWSKTDGPSSRRAARTRSSLCPDDQRKRPGGLDSSCPFQRSEAPPQWRRNPTRSCARLARFAARWKTTAAGCPCGSCTANPPHRYPAPAHSSPRRRSACLGRNLAPACGGLPSRSQRDRTRCARRAVRRACPPRLPKSAVSESPVARRACRAGGPRISKKIEEERRPRTDRRRRNRVRVLP